MEKALNGQLNAEFYSAYLYLSMAGYFESIDLKGFANWMRVQVQEEQFHTMKLYDYIFERGSKISLRPVDAPPSDWDCPLAVFEATLEHEQKVTGLINDLVYLARTEKMPQRYICSGLSTNRLRKRIMSTRYWGN
jgi:ferritin